jgi:hypothetical protein
MAGRYESEDNMCNRWSILLLLLTCTCACAPRGPVLSVEEPVWNLGAVVAGSMTEKRVELVNSGDAPLVIEKIEECCGFYGQIEEPLTIPPHGRVPMTLQLNPFKMIGDLNAKLTVVSNDPQQPRFSLQAIGQVVPKIYALAELPEHRLDLGLLETGVTTPFALRIANPGNAPLVLRSLEKSGAIREAGSLGAIPANDSGVWTFNYTAQSTGPIEETLVISTNDALHRTLVVQLRGYVVPREEARHGLLISPVGTKAVYDVGKKVYRYDFVLRNQGAGRVSFAIGAETLPDLRLDLPSVLEPGEERAASAILPLSPAGGTLELRVILPFMIQ